MTTTPPQEFPNRLKACIADAADWLHMENGQTYRLGDLSRDDLIQVAANGIALLERLETLSMLQAELIENWRHDRPQPHSLKEHPLMDDGPGES